MSYWIPTQRMTMEPAVVSSSALDWTRLVAAARERLAGLCSDGLTRTASLVGKLLARLAGASAHLTRALERAAHRLDPAGLLPDDLLVDAEEPAVVSPRCPPPIPAEARRAIGATPGQYPALVTGPLMAPWSPSIAPRA